MGGWMRTAVVEVRPCPLLPQTPIVVLGGGWPHNLHATGGVKKHRCLSRAIARHPILSGHQRERVV